MALDLEALRDGGSARAKAEHNILERPNVAYGLFRAADLARAYGKKNVTVCEFGVAEGKGLLNMIELAALIGDETGINFKIFGFDSGQGLTEIDGYKDHPELWTEGDFMLSDKDVLLEKINGKATMIFGDVKDTVQDFITRFDSEAPLGFVAIDLDLYSATKHALKCFLAEVDKYLPAISIYFDDICTFFNNKYCGELLAIEEFNKENEFRKLDIDRTMDFRAIDHAPWYVKMYVCHVLDHEARNNRTQREKIQSLPEYHEYLMKKFNRIY